MTDQQQRFVEEYVIDLNGAKAAVRAGYAKKSARYTAYDLKQIPEVANAIVEKLKTLSMTAEEAAKRISDNAATRLNDYLVVRKVIESNMVRRPLQVLIDELLLEDELEDRYFERMYTSMSEKEQNLHSDLKKERYAKRVRYEIELELNPGAYRERMESKVVEKVVVDLVALAKAEGKGAIKKLSFNEHGPVIESYPADAALRDVLQYHGKLVNKHQLDGEFRTVDTSSLTEEQRIALLEVARLSRQQ